MQAAEQFPLELANVLQCLGMLFWLNGSFPSALESLDRCVILANTVGKPADKIQALAIVYRSFTQMRLSNFQSALRDAQDALERFQSLEDAYGLALANYSLGRIAIEQAKYKDAQYYTEQALDWSRRAGDRHVIFLVLNSLELLVLSRGDFVEAGVLILETLKVAREMKDVWMISAALREAGNLAQVQGDYTAAAGYFSESGEISRQQGLLSDYARTRFNLGIVAILQGDLTVGRTYLHESREFFRQINHLRGLAECLDGLAALSAAQGQIELAARLLGAADAWFQSQGTGRWPVDQNEYANLQSQLEDRLGLKAFMAEYAAGQQINLEQALALGEKL
jgi:tetratricopeptide (TPR) repeat protein